MKRNLEKKEFEPVLISTHKSGGGRNRKEVHIDIANKANRVSSSMTSYAFSYSNGAFRAGR